LYNAKNLERLLLKSRYPIAFVFVFIFAFLSLSVSAQNLSEEDALFEKVYQDPTNIQLDSELTQLQLKNGNLKGAEVTLERILQLYPNEVSAKLLLAQTKFKLGSVFEAKDIYQDVIASSKANDEQKKVASDNLQYIVGLETKWDFFGTAMISYGQSKNPTNSPQYITILGNNYQNTGFSNNSDRYEELYISVGLKYKIEDQIPSDFFSSFNYYKRQYNQFSTVDLDNYSWNIGYENFAFGGNNTLTNSLSKIDLGNKPFVNSDVLSLSHEHFLLSNLRSLSAYSLGYNKHQECDNCASSDTRTNWMNSFSQTITLGLTDKWIAEVTGSYANYDAKVDYESYEMTSALLSTTYNLPIGSVSISKNYSYSHYGDFDPIALIKRQITLNTQSISFITAPFHFQNGWESWQDWFHPQPPKKEDWLMKFNAQWGKSDSEIQTYQRDIQEFTISLVKSF
jgi:hypothetical protein